MRGTIVSKQSAIVYLHFHPGYNWERTLGKIVASLPKLIELSDPVSSKERICAGDVGVMTLPFIHGMDLGHFAVTIHIFLTRHPKRMGHEEEMLLAISEGLKDLVPEGGIQVAISPSDMVAMIIRGEKKKT